MKKEMMEELLLQALATEQGGIEVYTAALEAVQNPDLAKEWKEYLEQTTRHEELVRETMVKLGIDPDRETPGRAVVRHLGESLVAAIRMAQEKGDPASAELVAAECVVLAETKDHQNWELIGELADAAKGETRKALSAAYEEAEDQEDEHLYHTQGWARELWIQALGMPAALPPPEEEKDVKSAIGAARAKKARKELV